MRKIEKKGFQTLGGIPAQNSSNEEPLPSSTRSSPSQSSERSTVDIVTSTGLLRPYQKSDGAIPILSAFSTRTSTNPDQLQPPGIPVAAFSPLLTPAMMAAQIGLLSTPNTLLSMMQAATAQNSLMNHSRCNDRNGQIVPTMLHQLSAIHSNQALVGYPKNELVLCIALIDALPVSALCILEGHIMEGKGGKVLGGAYKRGINGQWPPVQFTVSPPRISDWRLLIVAADAANAVSATATADAMQTRSFALQFLYIAVVEALLVGEVGIKCRTRIIDVSPYGHTCVGASIHCVNCSP
uniref:Uncharacterized protein n=1 Tax=Setaria digitata TaxID=48799 RepID=A0A915PNJ7_9BILA